MRCFARCSILAVGLAAGAGTASAADVGGYGAGGYAPPGGGSVHIAPVRPWYYGGAHWRGHHDLTWRVRDPNFSYFTYGWGQSWYYSPRGAEGYAPERPRVVMPTPVEPTLGDSDAPAAWTAPWYEYCSAKFSSFDPETGFYTSRSGKQRMCR